MDMRRFFLLPLFGLLLTGCSKEGPAGPAGPAGASGAGNVHVESFTVAASDWEVQGNGMQHVIQVPSLTQEVIDQDAVLLYFERNGIWHILPYQVNGLQYTYSYQVGEVTTSITGTQIPIALTWKLVYMHDSD
jgi:hypothetical protein